MESSVKEKRKMKITAGIGSVDDYPDYVQAGADELFCGYVPEIWALKNGSERPLNRREVRYYNVQLGSESELEILQEMISKYQVPVTIALNALSYEPEDLGLVEEIIERCVELGFESFIVADPVLLFRLTGLSETVRGRIKIHISGEMSEVNHEMIRMWKNEMVTRVIFHRNTSLTDMQKIIKKSVWNRQLEYEAFVLNERCHYHGAYCNSLHCDELTHMCRVPYRFVLEHPGKKAEPVPGKRLCMEETGERTLGESGCGLCGLWKMKAAGVNYLKVVSRGNYAEDTCRDIKAVKEALEILEYAESEEAYKKKIKSDLFMEKCSKNCYYWKQL